MAKVTSIVRDRGRAFGVVVALAMSATLVVSPAAFGAKDPVATGTFKLKLGGPFKAQLRANGVKMKPKSPRFKSGSLNPITGGGILNLSKITFKKGNKKLVYGKVRARLRANAAGIIKGSKGKLFLLRGGTVTRDGFGAIVTGIKAKFLRKAAKRINRELDLSSLHRGRVGTAKFNEQPQTVEVLGGTASVVLSTSAGSVFSKLPEHCINPTPGTGGLDIVAPATHPNPLNPLLTDFPVVGGTIGPTATDGVVNEAGGVKFTKNITGPNGLGQTCPAGGQSVQQVNSAVNLGLNNIQASVVIAGTGNSLVDGDKGLVIVSGLDVSGRTFSADPASHTITTGGDVITLSAISAQTLNQVFPQGTPADPASEFAAGDVFGTSGRTVTTR